LTERRAAPLRQPLVSAKVTSMTKRYPSFAKAFNVVAGLLMILIGSGLPSTLRADDEFKAFPGLWKTTIQSDSSTLSKGAKVQWHCVYENADPWSSFGYLSRPGDRSCERTYFRRTSTSLQWRIKCADVSTTYEGSIVFSSAEHYTGKVMLRGPGGAAEQTITVEGKRYAACTSPQD
jgi:hypothetical protein